MTITCLVTWFISKKKVKSWEKTMSLKCTLILKNLRMSHLNYIWELTAIAFFRYIVYMWCWWSNIKIHDIKCGEKRKKIMRRTNQIYDCSSFRNIVHFNKVSIIPITVGKDSGPSRKDPIKETTCSWKNTPAI